ncbi:MAG: hypothetical protein M1837_001401 [Sclerophora amabilis]|nr:MAG: hypothetical protein M1837_001401 [Sclerophora amabilis]
MSEMLVEGSSVDSRLYSGKEVELSRGVNTRAVVVPPGDGLSDPPHSGRGLFARQSGITKTIKSQRRWSAPLTVD